MRRSTIAAGLTAALVSGAAVAVPAMATSGQSATTRLTSSANSTPGLTTSQQQALEQFLGTHPKVATALGKRLDAWKAFADANPAVVAELKKVAGLSPEQRRSELAAWAKANPAEAKAWQAFRQQVRQTRDTARDARREAREKRRAARTPGSQSGTPSGTPSTSPTSATTPS